ncbi:MAG: DUF5615 family PIN-like protein [Thermoflexales bacterium]|nr:DUF5615 family PIN-like protein [Thermoflexales bacterium]
MKFKLDENLGARTQHLFRAAGHDAQTILEEGLQGCSDRDIYTACCTEKRCLVTLDLDFSDVTRFPPTESAGIIVIRVPRNPSLPLLERLVSQFLTLVARMPVGRNLWVVEIGRIRIHESKTDDAWDNPSEEF